MKPRHDFMIYLQDPGKLGTLTNEELSTLSTVPQEDLPPPPSQEDIFGKVIALKSQFQKENEKIERQLRENQVYHLRQYKVFIDLYFKARMENNLQEKIAARRQRRARKNFEENEIVA